MWELWPHASSMTLARAFGRRSPQAAWHRPVERSYPRLPTRSWAGNLIRCSHFSRSGLNQRGSQPNFTAVKLVVQHRRRAVLHSGGSASARYPRSSGHENRLCTASSGDQMKLSPDGMPLTRMPAGASRVRLAMRLTLRTAAFGGGPAAQRMADHVDRRRINLIEEVEIVHGEVGHAAKPLRIVRGAEARMLRHCQRVVPREALKERQPRRPAAGTMEKKQRRPRAGAPNAHGQAAGHQAIRFLTHDGKSIPLPGRRARPRRCRRDVRGRRKPAPGRR